MGPMIDSRKIHASDTAVESQSGRATGNTRSRFRPKRALSYPLVPITKKVSVMRNRCGYFAAPDTGLTNEVLVGVGYMLWPSGTVVAVMHVKRLKSPNIPAR